MSNLNETLAKLSAPDLLNLIDQLHEIGIQDEIPLPQIIVVGSQSSGKSSVLEAISRLSFPRGQGLTTTFATEIALRKSPDVCIKARIIPAQSNLFEPIVPHTKAQDNKLRAWSKSLKELKAEDVASLVTDARDLINENSARGPGSFSFDKLRIEASGPDFPLLTLVDLPGLILTPNDNQTKQDVEDAERIVKKYMRNEQTIILAIISAETDLVNQKSVELAQEFDPKGNRTIGVITKPDLLPPKHPRIDYLIQCARGEIEPRKLMHGWFLLKNKDFDVTDITPEQRDQDETRFFETTSWAKVGPKSTGVVQLRTRLSKLQKEAVQIALPNVIDQIEVKLDQCKAEHKKLGDPRLTVEEKRDFLDKIATNFTHTAKSAVQGQYAGNSFFTQNVDGEPRKLRARLNVLYNEFRQDLEQNGRKTIVMSTEAEIEERCDEYHKDQEIISTDQMLERIRKLNIDNGGMSLDGMVNQYPLVASLFQEEAEKWETIAKRHVSTVYHTVLHHLCLIVEHETSNRETALKIQSELIKKQMASKQKQLMEKLKELVAPYTEWQPITRSHSYAESVYNINSESITRVNKAAPLIDQQDTASCALVLNHLEAYYTTARTIFIDNVLILAFEMLLLKDLHMILSPSTILRMDAQTLHFVASEPIEDQQHREQVTTRVRKLERANEVCNNYQHGLGHVSVEPAKTPDLTAANDPLSPTPSRGPETPSDVTHHLVSKKSFEWQPAPRGAFGPALQPKSPAPRAHSRSPSSSGLPLDVESSLTNRPIPVRIFVGTEGSGLAAAA